MIVGSKVAPWCGHVDFVNLGRWRRVLEHEVAACHVEQCRIAACADAIVGDVAV